MFETLAHFKLKSGGEFKIRELLPRNKKVPKINLSHLKLAPSQLRVVKDNHAKIASALADYRTAEHVYYKPTSKTFECIDAWTVLQGETWGFQYTVSQKHDISSAIYWYYQHLNMRHYVTVVYNQKQYEKFSYKNVKVSKQAPFDMLTVPPNGYDCRQYVMLVNELDGDLTQFDVMSMLQEEFVQVIGETKDKQVRKEFREAFGEFYPKPH